MKSKRNRRGGIMDLPGMNYRPTPEVREALEREVESSGKTKTRIIEEALRKRFRLKVSA